MMLARLTVAYTSLAIISSCGSDVQCEGLCGSALIHARTEVTTLYPPAFVVLTDLAVAGQIFIRLADLDTSLNTAGDASFIPRLARTWEFEDDVTLRFDLAPNARWHDGTPVTAADVVFTYETYRDPETNASARTLIDRVINVEARDDHTAVFTFSNPYVEQFFDATHHMRIIPKHLLDSIPAGERRDHPISAAPIGSGPYRFVEWLANDRLELNAVEDYFEGQPGIARLIWQTLPVDAVALDGLANETIDIVPQVIAPPHHERVEQITTATRYPYPSSHYGYFGFNFTDPSDQSKPHPIFQDRDVRRAIAMAIDRQAISDAAFGPYGSLPNSLAPPSVRTNSVEAEQIPFDPEAARQLLASKGWTDADGDGMREKRGHPLSFDVMTPSSSRSRGRAAVQIQEYLSAVGVEMGINEVPIDSWVARSQSGEFSSTMGSWSVTPTPSAVRGLWNRASFQGLNWTRYYNPAFDDLVERARNESNPETEFDLWRQAYSIFNQDAAVVMVFSPSPAAAVNNRIINVSVRGDEWATTLWTWRINPDAMLPRDHLPRR